MATPKTVTDGVTELEEASLNKYISGDGVKVQIKMLYATFIYSAGNLIVDPNHDSCGIITGDISYDTGNDWADITVSGFTNRPHVQATTYATDGSFTVKAKSTGTTNVRVYFYDSTDGSRATPGAIDANMNFHIM